MRTIAPVLAAALCALIVAGPSGSALAMSTQREIEQGKQASDRIDAQSIIVTDPFLTSWVQGIGARLAAQRKRTDITYRFITIDTPEINAFALPGGYLHVDTGLLNFVSSDDELAGVLAHEMGHVELHHVTKLENVGSTAGILAAILSIINPIFGALGSVGAELATQRYSRKDELQADHYGLTLMTASGYDPRAMVDMMTKLGHMEPGPDSRADKAFQDHPNPKDRVAHLLGYRELDRPAPALVASQVLHDQSEGRYSYARARLLKLQTDAPAVRTVAQAHLAEVEMALRESGPRAAASTRIVTNFMPPTDPFRSKLDERLRTQLQTINPRFDLVKAKARNGLTSVSSYAHALQNFIDAAGPAAQPQPAATSQPVHGPPPATAALGPGPAGHNALVRIVRDMTASLQYDQVILSNAPDFIAQNRATLREMQTFVADPQLTPKSQTLLEYYPLLLDQMQSSTDDLADASDRAVANIDRGMTLADEAMQVLRSAPAPAAPGAAPKPGEVKRYQDALQKLVADWDAAAQEASAAADLIYLAQARDITTEISLLDLYSAPERYDLYAKSLAYRFPGVSMPNYAIASRSGLQPGQLACAAWIAFETKSPVTQVMTDLRAAGRPCETAALERHLSGLSLEIAAGLVYENYIDEPPKPL